MFRYWAVYTSAALIEEQNEGDDEGLDGASIAAIVLTFIGALLVVILMGYAAITFWKPEMTKRLAIEKRCSVIICYS